MLSNHSTEIDSVPGVRSPPDSSLVKKSNFEFTLQDRIAQEALAKFDYIDENEYKGSAQGLAPRDEFVPCQCAYEPGDADPETACGLTSECINRALFIECKDSCPCGDFCKNKRFRKKCYAAIEIMDCGPKGHGIRAVQDLPANTFVIEYIGEVVSKSAFIKRTRQYSESGQRHHYFMSLKLDEVIDATKRGGIARFINHSCNPNCVLQKWIVGKHLRMGIFTKVAVPKGTELTFDYKFERYGATAQKCHCGEPNCKGIIGVVKKPSQGAAPLPDDEFANDSDDSGIDSDDVPSNSSPTNKLAPETDESDIESAKKHRGLQTADEVTRFIPKMYRTLSKKDQKKRAMRCLEKLEATDNIDLLKQFLNTHGLRLLKLYWQEFDSESPMLRKILMILQKLPILTRNTIDDLKLEAELLGVADVSSDIVVQTLSRKLVSDWSSLQTEYRIPKRVKKPQETKEILEQESVRSQSTPGSPYERESGPSRMNRFTDYQHRFEEYRRDSFTSSNSGGFQSRPSLLNPKPAQFVDNGQLQLPPHWTRHFDDRQGKYFYRNSRTGTTQWDFPRFSAEDEFMNTSTNPTQPASTSHSVSSEQLEQLLNAAKQNFKAGIIPLTEEEEKRKKKKKELLKRKQKQEQREKEHDSTSSKKAKSEPAAEEKVVDAEMKKELRDEIASVVLKNFSRFKQSLPTEEFKKHARKITHLIIEKESRDKQIISIDEDVRRKIRKFVDHYAGKLNLGSASSS